MRYLILLALLLTPTLCHAGMAAKRMLAVMNKACNASNATVYDINDVASINSSGTSDTGTETPSALPICSGTVTTVMSCNGGDGGASVYLAINGVISDSRTCGYGTTLSSVTLSAPVNGRYSVRIYGGKSGTTSSFSAGSFSVPVAQ